MITCGRCDWQPTREPDSPPAIEQLHEHALAADHPHCCVCALSLTKHEPQTCERCLSTAQQHLANIREMWDELPGLLGRRSSSQIGRGPRGGTDGPPLPGGDLLVFLGPGSEGVSDDGTTAREGDPASIDLELGYWHEEWMDASGERAADRRPGRVGARVEAAFHYLEIRMRWAATSHPGFGRFAVELRRIHGQLERATDRARQAAQAGASCFDCGGILERPVHNGLEVEGVVKCRGCRAVYSPQRYLLALAARRQEGIEALGLDGWVPYRAAAAAAERPLPTIWSWVQRLQVPAVCRLEDRAVLVWYPAVDERAPKCRKNVQDGAA